MVEFQRMHLRLHGAVSSAGDITTARAVISTSTIISTATGHQPPAAATAAVQTNGSGPPMSAPVTSRASAMPEKRSRVSNSSVSKAGCTPNTERRPIENPTTIAKMMSSGWRVSSSQKNGNAYTAENKEPVQHDAASADVVR